MAKKRDAWGIEVGSNALKAIHLVQDAGDSVRVADYEVMPFKQVLTAPDVDADQSVQENLDQLLTKHDLTRSPVAVSVPGNMAFARFAKLPPVDPKKISEIVKFEAAQQIPFPIEQVEWDYEVFADEDSPDVGVGIFAITKERVGQILSNYRSVGIQLNALTLAPIAAFNAAAYDLNLGDDSEGMVLLDIGTTSTDVIIIEHGDLWLRTISTIGGHSFTEALVKAFKLSYAKAEKLKREAGTSKYARQIFQAMRPVFADLVQEVQRSLGFYQSMNRDAKITKLVGVGSTFRLPGLQKFLKQQLQMDVIRPDGFKTLSVEGATAAEFADQAMDLFPAYGLALQGLGLARIDANILPAAILRQRAWRAKQPWFATAAACMMAVSGLAGFKYWTTARSFEQTLEQNQQEVDAVLRQAQGYRTRWQTLESHAGPGLKLENLRRLLDYRDIWPKLLTDMHQALLAVKPQEELLSLPDAKQDGGSSLTRSQRKRIYIQQIESTYGAMVSKPADPGMGDPGVGGGGYGGGGFGGGGFGGGGGNNNEMAGPADQPKAFKMTLRGWTPYAGGPELIADTLIQWFREHAKQADRPYEYKLDKEDVSISMTPRAAAGRTGGGPVSGSPGMGMSPQSGANATPPSGFIGRVRPGQPSGGTGTTVDLKTLLPDRPGLDESDKDDWLFTVSFKVQLLPPEKARQSSTPGTGSSIGSPSAESSFLPDMAMSADAASRLANGLAARGMSGDRRTEAPLPAGGIGESAGVGEFGGIGGVSVNDPQTAWLLAEVLTQIKQVTR